MKKTLFVLLTLLLVVVVLEGATYVIWRKLLPRPARRVISYLCGEPGATIPYRANAFWHHELNPQDEAYRDLLNSRGTKGREFVMPKPADDFRVICVGNSTVEGLGLPVEQTFPYLLEELLQPALAAPGRRRTATVINGGVSGHNSAFVLSHLALKLLNFAPDLVVVKCGFNDYLPYIVPGMQYDYTHAFARSFDAPRARYWSFARHSFLLKTAGYALYRDEIQRQPAGFWGELTPEQYRRMDFSANSGKFAIYEENLRSLVFLCRGRGIPVVFLDIPTSPLAEHYLNRDIDVNYRAIIARLEESLRSVAARERVPLLVTGLTAADDFTDHCHNTPAGNLKIARRLLDFIIGEKLPDGTAPLAAR